MILEVAYGYQAKDENDEYIDLVARAITNFSAAAAPGAHIVDTFPWRKWYRFMTLLSFPTLKIIFHIVESLPDWLPGMGWKQVAKEYSAVTHDFLNIPFQYVLKNRVSRQTILGVLIVTHRPTL
jgi:hypothetical protein